MSPQMRPDMRSVNWSERAEAAAASAGIRIADVASLADIDRAIEVMIATWGPHQLVPSELFSAFADARDVVQAAWRGDEMIGFTLGFYGRDDDGWNLHSHMLAVNPEERGSGIGYALKLAQAAAVAADGVARIRWTFDPLLSRNAYFNLAKLGASADAFARDFYGAMPDDLNAGDRSDRLFVRWDLDGEPFAEVDGAGVLLERDGDEPVASDAMPVADTPLLLKIPREYPDLRVANAALADRWRDEVAAALERSLAAGLLVRGFTSDSAYVLA